MLKPVKRHARALLIAASLGSVIVTGNVQAQDYDDKPGLATMSADLFVARPLMAAYTVAGAFTYVISLPFTLISGDAGEAADTLVVDPAKSTFLRCLGCLAIDENR